MNININNYESFFLMYVDNELSATEKATVDAFIKEYPYLGDELQLLQSMVLPTEENVVLDKNSLYRSAAIDENMEEAMLLQLDNQLPAASSEELIKSIAADKMLQQNWDLLLKTRLPAEEIVFADKKSLYKKEEATIVSFRFVRWAVAAALLAAGLFTAVTLLRQQAQTGVEFANSGNKGQSKDSGLATKNTVTESETGNGTPAIVAQESTEIASQQNNETITGNKRKSTTNLEQVSKNNNATIATAKLPAVQIQKSFQTVLPKEENINVLAANNNRITLPASNNEVNMSTSLAESTVSPEREMVERNIIETKQSFAKLTSLQDDDDDNNDRILGIDADAVGRTKAGVFFKKLKRTVTRSANIKTGNSLKIAGFEFAVK